MLLNIARPKALLYCSIVITVGLLVMTDKDEAEQVRGEREREWKNKFLAVQYMT